ncbi:MAG: SAM-dependent methyltransferase [Bacteroidota bacterium]
MKTGILYLIPSLLSEDNPAVIPFDTLKIIHALDHFVVENEKTARHFLKSVHYPKPLQSLNLNVLDEHTKAADVSILLKPVMEGKNLGIISEAGCPAVADPGSDLVHIAHLKNIEIIPLVGPSSLLLALMGSGMNGQQFSFSGYLPKDKNARVKAIKELERMVESKNQTQIFIEAPYRNQHLLEDILQNCSASTLLCLAAELTSSSQFVKTKTIAEWKKEIPDIQKKPVVFLLGR